MHDILMCVSIYIKKLESKGWIHGNSKLPLRCPDSSFLATDPYYDKDWNSRITKVPYIYDSIVNFHVFGLRFTTPKHQP